MPRPSLRVLRVSGPGKADAEIDFGPGLTHITGLSDTGKSHVLECLDFALGASTRPRAIPEHRGYTHVLLELEKDGQPYLVRRAFDGGDTATIAECRLDAWDGEAGDSVKVDINPKDPASTLSGWLLELADFDLAAPVISNRKGKTQTLSFRAVAPLVLVKEDDVISASSPVLSPQWTRHTANRSVFQILLTGDAPSPRHIEVLQGAHEQHQKAVERLGVLDRMIEELRMEIREADLNRSEMEAESARIEKELSSVSEVVSESGSRLRELMRERNRAISASDQSRRAAAQADELGLRFELLGQHYEADIQRLEFVLEGGHFFQQLAASHCPSCGRPVDPDAACHPESADFHKIEQAARAEIRKLVPRMEDLKRAIRDAHDDAKAARRRADRSRHRAAELDAEIRQVADPSAKAARERVATITQRRRALDGALLRFRELDRYIAAREEAAQVAGRQVEHYRPGQDLPSLRLFSAEVQRLLSAWKFPMSLGVNFSPDTDDLVIDGKDRKAFGKGTRAVTHAAFTVALMRHCMAAETPHPGFVMIDTPLTPFRGLRDDVDDPQLTRDVRTACLYSLATLDGEGQVVVIENVDPPDAIRGKATIHQFVGPEGEGRRGFYPTQGGSG